MIISDTGGRGCPPRSVKNVGQNGNGVELENALTIFKSDQFNDKTFLQKLLTIVILKNGKLFFDEMIQLEEKKINRPIIDLEFILNDSNQIDQNKIELNKIQKKRNPIKSNKIQ